MIANPASRRGSGSRLKAERAFEDAGVRCETLVTERPGHAAVLAAEHGSRFRAIFSLGGDGTAMEIVDALAHSGIPIGVLPGGTGNLIARSLGIPLRVDRAVSTLLAGREADIDLGAIDGARRFAFAAGVGIDARMIEATPSALKRRFGVSAYMVAAAAAALRHRVFDVRVEVDGEVVERRAAAVMLANFGSVLSDLVTLGPGILRDDGRLDLCIFSPRSRLDALVIAWRLFRQDFRGDPRILYRSGCHFRIECRVPEPYQADGEVLGTTPFAVTVDPLAARLLVPSRG
ncbi:MAG: diacylglycerol/lipid kinase family protein [Gemmatimonadaceae bacterium]